MSSERVCVVVCTCPASAAAELARALLDERLIACVNIIPGVRSIYRWRGVVKEDEEHILFMKTAEAAYARLESRLAELHPYEMPEILRLRVDDGEPAYLSWVLRATAG